MSSTDDAIQRILGSALPVVETDESSEGPLHKPGTKQLIRSLLELYSKTSEGLASEAALGDFSKMWLIRGLAHELLQNSIEDAYVDLKEDRERIFRALRELYEHNHWFEDPRLHSLLSACREIANKEPIPDIRVQIKLDDGIPAIARVAARGRPLIQVSSKAYNLAPILEDSIAHPAYVRQVENGYAAHLWQLKKQFGLTALCFVEKDIGPVGALSMASVLVRQINLPAMIYRVKRWSMRSKVAGYVPSPSDRIAIIYDLLVTGDALQQVAHDLSECFQSKPVAAVVLFGYEGKRDRIPLGSGALEVRALGWYDTTIRDEAEQIRSCKVSETKHIRRLSAEDIFRTSSWNGTEGIDSMKEEKMSAPIKLEDFEYGIPEEDLDIVLTGLERLTRPDLVELWPDFNSYNSARDDLGSASEWELRHGFDEIARQLYHQNPVALRTIRARIEEISVQILERETQSHIK